MSRAHPVPITRSTFTGFDGADTLGHKPTPSPIRFRVSEGVSGVTVHLHVISAYSPKAPTYDTTTTELKDAA